MVKASCRSTVFLWQHGISNTRIDFRRDGNLLERRKGLGIGEEEGIGNHNAYFWPVT